MPSLSTIFRASTSSSSSATTIVRRRRGIRWSEDGSNVHGMPVPRYNIGGMPNLGPPEDDEVDHYPDIQNNKFRYELARLDIMASWVCCWAYWLCMSGILLMLILYSVFGFKFWMDSPYCDELAQVMGKGQPIVGKTCIYRRIDPCLLSCKPGSKSAANILDGSTGRRNPPAQHVLGLNAKRTPPLLLPDPTRRGDGYCFSPEEYKAYLHFVREFNIL